VKSFATSLLLLIALASGARGQNLTIYDDALQNGWV